MSYQKCPLCNGCGSTGIGFPTGEPCKVCGGTGIISEQTGKPPEYKYKTQSDTTEHCDTTEH
jgi:DnaJ-class molecular chaperone